MTAMLEFSPNQAMIVEQIRHPDPEISIHVVNDFLEDPGLLLDYAENKAYFGKPGGESSTCLTRPPSTSRNTANCAAAACCRSYIRI